MAIVSSTHSFSISLGSLRPHFGQVLASVISVSSNSASQWLQFKTFTSQPARFPAAHDCEEVYATQSSIKLITRFRHGYR